MLTLVSSSGYIKHSAADAYTPVLTPRAVSTWTDADSPVTLTGTTYAGAHDNYGAAGAVTVNLPSLADAAGHVAHFSQIAGQDLVLVAPAALTMWYGGRAYTQVTIAAAASPASVEIYSDGEGHYITRTSATGGALAE